MNFKIKNLLFLGALNIYCLQFGAAAPESAVEQTVSVRVFYNLPTFGRTIEKFKLDKNNSLNVQAVKQHLYGVIVNQQRAIDSYEQAKGVKVRRFDPEQMKVEVEYSTGDEIYSAEDSIATEGLESLSVIEKPTLDDVQKDIKYYQSAITEVQARIAAGKLNKGQELVKPFSLDQISFIKAHLTYDQSIEKMKKDILQRQQYIIDEKLNDGK